MLRAVFTGAQVQGLKENRLREKGRDLTQSYDKSLYIDRKIKKSNVTTQKRYQKTSITQRLRTDGQLG